MDTLLTATIVGLLVLVASMVSVELGISVAIIEICFGVIAGNFLVRATARSRSGWLSQPLIS
jgi:hypothetical protein